MRSSSSSSTSQRYQSTKALRGRIEYLVHITFGAVDSWKQRSRFNGWQWGIVTGSVICTLVLLVNLAFVVLGASSKTGYNKGIATIITGNADEVSRWSTLLHIIINILSTLLLSASNYAMQVLAAPTHGECVRAHQQGKLLDVGILSMRNIKSLTLRRKVLWLALCTSSLPLHLLQVQIYESLNIADKLSYNASVFQVVTANEYSIDFIQNGSTTWNALNNGSSNKYHNLSSLSVDEITTTYDQEYVSAHGDVILCVKKLSVEYENLSTFNDRGNFNFTLGALNLPLEAPIVSKSRFWAQAIDSRGWANATALNEHWSMTRDSATLLVQIVGANARPVTNSEVQMSLTFLMVVVACNAVKVACLGFLLWKGTDDMNPPLVTIGDAISSFLEAPDSSTRGYCTYSKAEFFWKSGHLKRTLAREHDGRAAKWDRRCEGIWEERTNNYGSAISKRKRVILTIL